MKETDLSKIKKLKPSKKKVDSPKRSPKRIQLEKIPKLNRKKEMKSPLIMSAPERDPQLIYEVVYDVFSNYDKDISQYLGSQELRRFFRNLETEITAYRSQKIPKDFFQNVHILARYSYFIKQLIDDPSLSSISDIKSALKHLKTCQSNTFSLIELALDYNSNLHTLRDRKNKLRFLDGYEEAKQTLADLKVPIGENNKHLLTGVAAGCSNNLFFDYLTRGDWDFNPGNPAYNDLTTTPYTFLDNTYDFTNGTYEKKLQKFKLAFSIYKNVNLDLNFDNILNFSTNDKGFIDALLLPMLEVQMKNITEIVGTNYNIYKVYRDEIINNAFILYCYFELKIFFEENRGLTEAIGEYGEKMVSQNLDMLIDLRTNSDRDIYRCVVRLITELISYDNNKYMGQFLDDGISGDILQNINNQATGSNTPIIYHTGLDSTVREPRWSQGVTTTYKDALSLLLRDLKQKIVQGSSRERSKQYVKGIVASINSIRIPNDVIKISQKPNSDSTRIIKESWPSYYNKESDYINFFFEIENNPFFDMIKGKYKDLTSLKSITFPDYIRSANNNFKYYDFSKIGRKFDMKFYQINGFDPDSYQLNYEDCNFNNIEIYGCQSSNFKRCDFEKTEFTYFLGYVEFENCYFKKTKVERTPNGENEHVSVIFKGTEKNRAKLEDVQFVLTGGMSNTADYTNEGYTFEYCHFIGGKISELEGSTGKEFPALSLIKDCIFDKTALSFDINNRVAIRTTQFNECDFKNIGITGGRSSDFDRCGFRKSDLTNLVNSSSTGGHGKVSFTNSTDLTGIKLPNNCYDYIESFEGSKFLGDETTDFTNKIFSDRNNGVNFSGCRLVNISFKNTNLRGCNFSRCYVKDCDFEGADVEGANFANMEDGGGNKFGLKIGNAIGISSEPVIFGKNLNYADNKYYQLNLAESSGKIEIEFNNVLEKFYPSTGIGRTGNDYQEKYQKYQYYLNSEFKRLRNEGLISDVKFVHQFYIPKNTFQNYQTRSVSTGVTEPITDQELMMLEYSQFPSEITQINNPTNETPQDLINSNKLFIKQGQTAIYTPGFKANPNMINISLTWSDGTNNYEIRDHNGGKVHLPVQIKFEDSGNYFGCPLPLNDSKNNWNVVNQDYIDGGDVTREQYLPIRMFLTF